MALTMAHPPQNRVEDKHKPNQCEDHGYNGCGVRLRDCHRTKGPESFAPSVTTPAANANGHPLPRSADRPAGTAGDIGSSEAYAQNLTAPRPTGVHWIVFVRGNSYSQVPDWTG